MRTLLAILVCALGVRDLSARPAHKQALAQYFGPFLPKKLNDCRTCHLPGASSEEEKPHNAFGERLASIKKELRKQDKSTSFEARLEAILKEDSDGDGVSNLIEILTGHVPGEKDDRPAEAELVRIEAKVADFTRRQLGYPWKPFETVKKPQAPTVKNQAWVRNPIDAFIAAEQESRGIAPNAEASKAILLRRVSLDLIGLPPTAAELKAFLEDTSPTAYEKVVDRLLASPLHAERWARHWMDVWRYSDWAGFGAQIRDSQPHIWRWRDWIVTSLEKDKPYDRMILEMLAGDELAPEDPEALIATGYLVRNWKLLSREKWIQDTVEHTFQAFQGVTIQCAKCHDHMYDLLSQREYYQLRAVFEPHNVRIDKVPGVADTAKDGIARVYDKDLATVTYLFTRGDDRTPDKTQPMTPGVPESLGGGLFAKLDALTLPPGAVTPDQRDFVQKDAFDASAKAIGKAKEALEILQKKPGSKDEIAVAEVDVELAVAKHLALERILAVEKLESQKVKEGPLWTKSAQATVEAQRLVAKFETRRKLLAAQQVKATLKDDKKIAVQDKVIEEATKAIAKLDEEHKAPAGTNFTRRTFTSYPTQSTGRRLAFAKWLANPQNPLTARVAINHVWMRHFGHALVPTPADFGRNGRAPIHPALVDWLASRFMEQGWSFKDLHRLIVTSATYRQASTPTDASAAIDRDNQTYWRFPPHRLEAEAVRDSLFYVAGELDLTRGGPEFDFPLGLTTPRRSLYFRNAAEKQMEFLQLFDGPSVTECYERKHSIIPQQALALLNSDLTLSLSRTLARKLASEKGDFVTAAFAHVLSRAPSADESTLCAEFLEEQTTKFRRAGLKGGASSDPKNPASDPVLRARENLVHVLMNHHEFVTVR